MATQTPAATGWPFLVASGRRRDYSTLLAPDFLVADLDYGILDEVVRPGDERAPATVVQARTRAGRDLTIVYATHLLTAEDIGSPTDAVDEHGRPLRLIYGFVCSSGRVATPAPADLDTVRDMALTVYRRFRADEDDITVAAGKPFALKTPPLRTPTVKAPTVKTPTVKAPTLKTSPVKPPTVKAPTAKTLMVNAPTTMRLELDRQRPRPADRPVYKPTGGGGRPIAVGLTVLLGLVIAAVFGIVLLLRPNPIEPITCPTATATAKATATATATAKVTATATAGPISSPSTSPSCVRPKAVSANPPPPLYQQGVRTPATPRSEEETQV